MQVTQHQAVHFLVLWVSPSWPENADTQYHDQIIVLGLVLWVSPSWPENANTQRHDQIIVLGPVLWVSPSWPKNADTHSITTKAKDANAIATHSSLLLLCCMLR